MLVDSPLNKYKKAIEVFRHHEGTLYHMNASIDAESFIKWFEALSRMDIRNAVNANREKQAEEHREKFRSITKTVILCGRQDLALRGHTETGNVTNEPPSNDGNFRAFLRF